MHKAIVSSCAWGFSIAVPLLLPAFAEAQACSAFSATNDAHVSAGRATTNTAQSCSACTFGICGFPSGCNVTSTSYLAAGSRDVMGTSGSATTTLYQTGTTYRTTAPTSEACGDSLDNDCDGQVDCADSQCTSDPSCAAKVVRWVNVPGLTFITDADARGSTILYNFGSSVVRGNRWTGRAPLYLPEGAVMRELRCFGTADTPLARGTVATVEMRALDGSLPLFRRSEPAVFPENVTGPVEARSEVFGIPAFRPTIATVAVTFGISFAAVAPATGAMSIHACSVGYTL